MTNISTKNNYLTLINVFTVDPSNQQKLIDLFTLATRTNEKTTITHVRKLLGTGSSGITIPGIRIAKIIEDPFFQVSSESLFIQSADVVAYTLKEKEFPKAARQKFQAHKVFERKLLKLCHPSSVAEADGIIRL